MPKNQQGVEQPIAFFSKVLRDATLKYDIMEKQAFSLVKALKYFRVYIFHSPGVAYVPSSAVKNILTQSDSDGRRGNWIAAILEYDIEIKPTKLIKGQGLARMMTESNLQSLQINFLTLLTEEYLSNVVQQVLEKFVASPWYADILYILQHLQAPLDWPKTKARFLKLKVVTLCIIDQFLYRKDPGGMLLNCLLEDEAQATMQQFHKGDCGRHLYWKTTVNKILRVVFIGPFFLLMFIKRLPDVENVRCLKEERSFSHYP